MTEKKQGEASAEKPKSLPAGCLPTLGLFILVLVILAAIGSCLPQPAPKTEAEKAADAVQSLSDALKRVDGVTDATRAGAAQAISVTVNSLDGSTYVPDALNAVRRISETMRGEKSSSIPAVVRITVSGPAVDRLGHTDTEPFIVFTYNGPDLATAELGNLPYGRQFDIPTDFDMVNGAGFSAVKAFCTSDKGSESNLSCPMMLAQNMRKNGS